jgi:hypothetical protein
MKNRYVSVFAITFLIGCAFFASSCVRQTAVHDPLGTVTLLPPYPESYPGAPREKISVQYAVMAVADQAGIRYDWDTSFRHTDPVCRQWVAPTILSRPFAKAMELILTPVNLTYTISNGKIILGYRR